MWDREKRIDLLTGHDMSEYFKEPEVPKVELLKVAEKEAKVPKLGKERETVTQFTIEQYNNAAKCWQETLDADKPKIPLVRELNIVSYNILGNAIFERTIEEAKLHGSVGLQEFAKVDRMAMILSALISSKADLISLQECDEISEKRIRACRDIKSQYFICSANALEPTSNLLILTKFKPNFFKIVKLTKSSQKVAEKKRGKYS